MSMMHETRVFGVLFVLIIALNFIINSYRLYRAKKLYTYYKGYLDGTLDKNYQGEKISLDDFNQKVPEIISIFKKAGLKSCDIPCERADDFGYVNHGSVNLFDNLSYVGFVSEANLPLHVAKYFSQCIGIYKTRLKNVLNPIIWIETFIYLPKMIFVYLGFLNSDSSKMLDVPLKIAQLIYWCLLCYLLFIKVF